MAQARLLEPLTDDELLAVADDPELSLKFTSEERRRLTRIRPQTAPEGDQLLQNVKNIGQFGLGVAKSGVQTVLGGGQLIRSIPGVGPLLAAGPEVDLPFDPQATNPQQAAGVTAGNVAQFFAPMGAVSKTATALKTGRPAIDAMIRSAFEGAAAGGVQAAQQGSIDDTGLTAGLAGGAGAVTRGLAAGTGRLAAKIETSLIKPTQADARDGFLTANIFKHKLGGTLQQTFEKTQAKLDDLSSQYKAAIAQTPGVRVNVLGFIQRAEAQLRRQATKTFGSNAAMQRALDGWRTELETLIGQSGGTVAANGTVDLATATVLKRAVGQTGAWIHQGGAAKVDPEAHAAEVVANTLYDVFKRGLEATVRGPVRQINQAMSELIPIERAVIRRIPVEARNNLVNLADMASWASGHWGLTLANRLLRFGPTAQALSAASTTPALASAAAPVMGAVRNVQP